MCLCVRMCETHVHAHVHVCVCICSCLLSCTCYCVCVCQCVSVGVCLPSGLSMLKHFSSLWRTARNWIARWSLRDMNCGVCVYEPRGWNIMFFIGGWGGCVISWSRASVLYVTAFYCGDLGIGHHAIFLVFIFWLIWIFVCYWRQTVIQLYIL